MVGSSCGCGTAGGGRGIRLSEQGVFAQGVEISLALGVGESNRLSEWSGSSVARSMTSSTMFSQ